MTIFWQCGGETPGLVKSQQIRGPILAGALQRTPLLCFLQCSVVSPSTVRSLVQCVVSSERIPACIFVVSVFVFCTFVFLQCVVSNERIPARSARTLALSRSHLPSCKLSKHTERTQCKCFFCFFLHNVNVHLASGVLPYTEHTECTDRYI